MNSRQDTEELFIQAPEGRLQALLQLPAEPPRAVVVALHPHPQHGGTMHNKVVHTMARTFVRLGCASLRFNFRGTEESAGSYDGGNGELADALAAMEWLGGRYPGTPMWLAGFSFGAAIGVRVAAAHRVAGLVSVAPAVARFAAGLGSQPDCPWLIVQGDEDELVDVAETIQWVNDLQPGPELQVIPGAEHFFHGRLNDLRDAVTTFVTPYL